MAEFVNWERAEQDAPSGREDKAQVPGVNLDFQPVQDAHDFDLALANIDGDDFSFWALEHFETSNLNPLDQVTSAAGPSARDPNDVSKAPCDACDASGFDCKMIEEGARKGSCTTCVTLGLTCSLPLADSNKVDSPRNVLLGTVQDTDPASNSSPDVVNSGNDNSPKPPAAPKVGARFSRDAVRILKAWLSTHAHRPYPNDEERENLQRQTGLNKTQIANWLANARRRSKGKFQPTRPTSPSVRGWSGAIEIPQRRGTPALDPEYLSPLQRWQNSPPENEPASVTAIASAILQSNPFDSGLNSPFNITDDDAARSCKDSSASSFGTSPSSKSFASALSAGSRASFGSFQQKGRRRRRRRALTNEGNDPVGLKAPPKTFQCTFCTETFRTKHDWQRHEKSLHLSLERWICCPRGPKAVNPKMGTSCCVFCDVADPDDAHIEGHNYTSCVERSLDERTFYRKDHLRQHLKLVHNAKYTQWSMDSWKIPTPEIRSKCGFCNLALSSWSARVDHLAEHFKTGSEMSSWKGDWGFEPGVLSMVENAIPPYMIHDERISPLPYQAGRQVSASPRNAYELISIELAQYIQAMKDTTGAHPSDDEMQHEACRIIYASEAVSKGELASQTTWLRDLLMSSDELRIRAQMGPLRGHAESFLCQMRVNGKDNIFEDCPMEKQLAEFVKARTLLNLATRDEELQTEACNIVGRMEESATTSSEEVSSFFLRLIHKTPAWLSGFRQRAGLPATEYPGSQEKPSVTPTMPNHSELEHELAEFVKNHQATAGTNPPDEELRKQARSVMYNRPDSWQRTAADDSAWLQAFKMHHFQEQKPRALSGTNSSPLNAIVSSTPGEGNIAGSFPNPASPVHNAPYAAPSAGYLMGSQLFLNGSFGFRRLAKELMRFAASTMSPNNPNQHIPTDEELQHQARWIMYDDDDPFNRTAADNPEWLLHFKYAIGIIPAVRGDGTPDALWAGAGNGAANQWRDVAMPLDASAPGPMQLDDNINSNSGATTTLEAAGPVDVLDAPLPSPGLVFASREFEDKLVQFAVSEVASSGRMPADEALQARAKEISGLEVWQAQPTPADDPVSLTAFKMMVVEKVKAVLGGHNDGAGHDQQQQQQPPPPPQAAGQAGYSPNHTSKRGMDAIDPGLLPALEPGMETGQSDITGALCAEVVHVAISEKRLDEIIDEALRSRC